MAKRRKGEAADAGAPARPRARRATTTLPEVTLPEVREAGDSADRAEQSEGPVMHSIPTEEDIRLRAYHRFLQRGGQHGQHEDDWIAAEQELRAPRGATGDPEAPDSDIDRGE